MPSIKAEIDLQKAAADAANITLTKLYRLLEEACARRKESASGMVAAVTTIAKLAGLWVEKDGRPGCPAPKWKPTSTASHSKAN